MENEAKRRISWGKYKHAKKSSMSLQTFSVSVSLLLVLLLVIIKKGPDIHVCCESYFLSVSQGHCSHEYPLLPRFIKFSSLHDSILHARFLVHQIKFFKKSFLEITLPVFCIAQYRKSILHPPPNSLPICFLTLLGGRDF